MLTPTILVKILLVSGALAFCLSIVVIPICNVLARYFGLVDRPDPNRKLHRGEISLTGGIAIFFAVSLSIAVVCLFIASDFAIQSLWLTSRWSGLAVAALAIVLLGVVDDAIQLSGKAKLLGQFVIVGLFVWVWQPADDIQFFGQNVHLGVFAPFLAGFWLIASINSVNLIDGADGVTGSFASVTCLGIAAIAVLLRHDDVAVVATMVSLATVGFLFFNRPPAIVFLGDAGSMLLGLVLGVLSCWATERIGQNSQPLIVPVTLLGLPLLDTSAAIIRRVFTGRSLYAGDRGHFHHILVAGLKSRDRSQMWIMLIFGGLAAITSAAAIAGTVFESDLAALLVVLAVAAGLVWARIFGHAETSLIACHTRRISGRIASRVRNSESPINYVSGIPLQGKRKWDEVWLPLVEFAEKSALKKLCLDLNMPWRHEGYHGYWAKGTLLDNEQQWVVCLPIICQQRFVGRIEISGGVDGNSQLESLDVFSHLISELQPMIEQLVGKLEPTESIAEKSDKLDLQPML